MPLCVRMQALREGYVPQQPDEAADRRTPAERKFDEIQAKREAERVAKLASKSHRDRVNDFNAYLANLSEHHDIPRVGPG
jgi:protein FAM32A